jgi:hypothetical protein
MCIADLCYFMSIATAKGHINDWKPARNRGKNLSFCVESKESLSGSFTVWFMALYAGYYYLACLYPIVQLSWRFMIFFLCCVYFTSNYVLLQHAYTVCKFIAPL